MEPEGVGLLDLRDCLYGSRGRMRMSVYEKIGTGYLTRTEGRTLAYVRGSGVA